MKGSHSVALRWCWSSKTSHDSIHPDSAHHQSTLPRVAKSCTAHHSSQLSKFCREVNGALIGTESRSGQGQHATHNALCMHIRQSGSPHHQQATTKVRLSVVNGLSSTFKPSATCRSNLVTGNRSSIMVTAGSGSSSQVLSKCFHVCHSCYVSPVGADLRPAVSLLCDAKSHLHEHKQAVVHR